MFKDAYRRDMDALALGEQGKEKILRAMEEEKSVKRNVGPTFLIAAALCAALAVTALAASPVLRDALVSLLRGLEPYVQSVDEMTATADGIEIKVMSAISDPNTARIYYEVRDLEGNRIDEKSTIGVRAYIPADGEIQWETMSYSGGASLHYDPESKAALMDTQIHWERKREENATVHLEFFELVTGTEWLTVPFPDDVELTTEILESETLKDGRVVLKPGQTFRVLDTDRYALSSVGFACDERLHYLWQIYDADFNPDESMIRCGVGSRSERAWHESRGETGSPCAKDYNNGVPDPVLFWEGGSLYYDVCTNAAPEDIADLIWNEEIEGPFCVGVGLEGPWTLDVPLVNAPAREIRFCGEKLFNGGTGDVLSITPLSATLISSREGTDGHMGYDMTLYLSDGTVIPNQWSRGNFSEDPAVAYNYWVFDDPIVPEDVIGIAIGQWYIPIRDDRTGAGCWLPLQP